MGLLLLDPPAIGAVQLDLLRLGSRERWCHRGRQGGQGRGRMG